MIIIVVGQPSSGKDTVSYKIVEYGFSHVSSGDIIRRDMKIKGLSLDRESMYHFVLKKRSKEGAFYPANEIAEQLKEGDNIVISGFRNLSEVDYLKKRFPKEVKVIALTVPLEIRFQRAKDRNRAGDDISLEKFKEQEDRERTKTEAHNLDEVIASADHLIENSGSLEDLYEKIESVMAIILKAR
ncbi:MAG: nucleoside monophosphate kinase [Patescibacteria group bacterium]|nr:MAG: nucleoside monophosphate kinase [Patescibacteria group bacterium]